MYGILHSRQNHTPDRTRPRESGQKRESPQAACSCKHSQVETETHRCQHRRRLWTQVPSLSALAANCRGPPPLQRCVLTSCSQAPRLKGPIGDLHSQRRSSSDPPSLLLATMAAHRKYPDVSSCRRPTQSCISSNHLATRIVRHRTSSPAPLLSSPSAHSQPL